jgi:hypothetical protein
MSFLTLKNFAVVTLCCAITCGCNAQNTTSSDQEIPPAVAKQLPAMQKRIDDLEHELANRPAVSQPNADGSDGAGDAAHTLADQAPAHPAPEISEGLLLPQSDPKKPHLRLGTSRRRSTTCPCSM